MERVTQSMRVRSDFSGGSRTVLRHLGRLLRKPAANDAIDRGRTSRHANGVVIAAHGRTGLEFIRPRSLAESGVRSAFQHLCWPIVLGALLLSGCRTEHQPAGDLLYRRYCASCHGIQGKGDGPVAASLLRPPSDLTTLARRSGGRFDERDVIAVIDGERLVAEHGPRAMPVWGSVFDEELRDEPHTQYTVLLRARVVSEYLRSIQEK